MDNNDNDFESSLKIIAKGSIIVLIGFIFSKIFTYGLKITLARYFGPEVYGLFTLAVMIVLFFVYFFAFGIPEGLLRFTSLYRGKSETNKINFISKYSILLLFISGTIGGIILFSLSEIISLNIFHNENLIIFLKGFSIIIPFYICFNLLLSLLRAYEKMASYSFLLNILQPGTNLFFLLILIFLGYKKNPIIFSYLLSFLIAFFASYLICKSALFKNFDNKTLSKKSKKEISISLLSYSWPLVFSGIISNIFNWTDSFIIGYFNTVSDVGYYNVATTFANLFSLVPAIIISIFYPLAVKEFSNNKLDLIKDLSKQITKWILIINLPVLIILILFPGAIINILFGSNYLIASNALKVLSVGMFIMSVLTISVDLISMKGKSKIILTNIIFVSILNFIFNLILVPRYGIDGAAFSTATSIIILGILLTVESRYFLSIVPLKIKMLKIILLSIIPSAILFYTRSFFPKSIISLFLQGLIFVLIYFGLIFFGGILDKNDFMIIKLIKNKFSNTIKNTNRND